MPYGPFWIEWGKLLSLKYILDPTINPTVNVVSKKYNILWHKHLAMPE
jgi:hypothetical protein